MSVSRKVRIVRKMVILNLVVSDLVLSYVRGVIIMRFIVVKMVLLIN